MSAEIGCSVCHKTSNEVPHIVGLDKIYVCEICLGELVTLMAINSPEWWTRKVTALENDTLQP
jgi:hypothetical protein